MHKQLFFKVVNILRQALNGFILFLKLNLKKGYLTDLIFQVIVDSCQSFDLQLIFEGLLLEFEVQLLLTVVNILGRLLRAYDFRPEQQDFPVLLSHSELTLSFNLLDLELQVDTHLLPILFPLVSLLELEIHELTQLLNSPLVA